MPDCSATNVTAPAWVTVTAPSATTAGPAWTRKLTGSPLLAVAVNGYARPQTNGTSAAGEVHVMTCASWADIDEAPQIRNSKAARKRAAWERRCGNCPQEAGTLRAATSTPHEGNSIILGAISPPWSSGLPVFTSIPQETAMRA